jgi:hypothetical protein
MMVPTAANTTSRGWKPSQTSSVISELTSGLRRLEVGDHIAGMGGRVSHFIATVDLSLGIDQVSDALRELGELLVRTASDLVLRADRTIDVAQQTEREVLRLGECQVVSGRVE